MKHLLPSILVSILLSGVPVLAASASADAPAEPVAVWRFWSPVFGRHFYTLDEAEKQKLETRYAQVWTCEGVACRAFANGADPNVVPVYRFWSGPSRTHFYTLAASERDKLISQYPDVWTYEGVAFYAYPADRAPAGTLPVYRFWSGSLGAHFYTISDTESFKLRSGYGSLWQPEGVGWYAYPPEGAESAAILKGPYVLRTTRDSAIIMWETDVPCDSRIDYGPVAPGGLAAYDPAVVTLHRVVLSGLAAHTTYFYRVSSGEAVSLPGSFTTAPSARQPFRFAVYGDSRSDPATHARVARNITDGRPGIVFHTGDLVGSGAEYALWQTEFFAPARELLLRAPLVPVPGNHEYVGAGPRWFFYFFDRPLDQGWWTLTYGNTRFLGLDTNAAFTPGSPQHTWLTQELASTEYAGATWHIVFFHEPAFTATVGHADAAAVREHLVPLLEQAGVDLVFQGHSHAYERYESNGIHYLVTAGGGAPLYPLAPDLVPPLRQFGLSTYHHCTVDVDPLGGSLIIRAIDLSGHIFDTVALSKSP